MMPHCTSVQSTVVSFCARSYVVKRAPGTRIVPLHVPSEAISPPLAAEAVDDPGNVTNSW
jgi:hypothetical protein